jgi:hypothetical protein
VSATVSVISTRPCGRSRSFCDACHTRSRM